MCVQIEEDGINPGPSLAVLQVIEQEHMISHVVTVGNKLLRQLREMGQRRRYVGRIVGMGFMVGIDLVEDKKSRQISKELAEWVVVKMKVNLSLYCLIFPQCSGCIILTLSKCRSRRSCWLWKASMEMLCI